jgi:hypothetical protein
VPETKQATREIFKAKIYFFPEFHFVGREGAFIKLSITSGCDGTQFPSEFLYHLGINNQSVFRVFKPEYGRLFLVVP